MQQGAQTVMDTGSACTLSMYNNGEHEPFWIMMYDSALSNLVSACFQHSVPKKIECHDRRG